MQPIWLGEHFINSNSNLFVNICWNLILSNSCCWCRKCWKLKSNLHWYALTRAMLFFVSCLSLFLSFSNREFTNTRIGVICQTTYSLCQCAPSFFSPALCHPFLLIFNLFSSFFFPLFCYLHLVLMDIVFVSVPLSASVTLLNPWYLFSLLFFLSFILHPW